MKKQLVILSLCLGVLILVGVFVGAYMEQIQGDEDKITYTATIFEGWNIMNGGIFISELITNESDVKLSDVSVIYYYSPSQKSYIMVYPEIDEIKFNIEMALSDWQSNLLPSSSVWVYSKKEGMIQYQTDDMHSMTKRSLSSGWNFVSVTENAIGQSLNDMKGTCDITTAYYFFKEYKSLDLDMKLPTDMSSMGLLIKVANDCQLGGSSSSETSPPPSIPN